MVLRRKIPLFKHSHKKRLPRRDRHGRFVAKSTASRDRWGRFLSRSKRSLSSRQSLKGAWRDLLRLPAGMAGMRDTISDNGFDKLTTWLRDSSPSHLLGIGMTVSHQKKKSVARKKYSLIKRGARRMRVYRDARGHFISGKKQPTLASRFLLRLKSSHGKKPRPAFNHLYARYAHATFVLLGLLFTSGSVIYFTVLKDLPPVTLLEKAKSPQTTIIRDRNGKVLYRVYRDANRVTLKWKEIPKVVKDATLAIEDDQFWYHHGISLPAMARALFNNLQYKDSGSLQGASTITQQLVKNRLLGDWRRTYERKIKEAFLAVLAELKYSKEQIFTMYLNEVAFGGTAYGIEAASQMYFGKSARLLSLPQAAFLAGLPAAPTTFSPYGQNPQMATIRQHQVLARMRELKMITDEAYYDAVNVPLTLAPLKTDIAAAHFVMQAKQELSEKLGEDVVEEGGLDVVTTLDLDIQNKVEEIVERQIGELQQRYKIRNGATLVTDTKTGEILAMVGSANYFDIANAGHVNATDAPRQTGSAIKPVTYALAFEKGGYTPTTVIQDSPVVYKTPGSKEIYAPVNYDGIFHGPQTVRSALANSYNIPAVKTLEKMGVDNMISMGIALGLKSWEQRRPTAGLSLTLGGSESTLQDMTRVFSTIANMGVAKDLRLVREIKDSTQRDLTAQFYYQNQSLSLVGGVAAADPGGRYEDGKQVITPLTAWWLIDILSDNNARLPAFGRNAKLSIAGHKIAVKTGTSNKFRDNWTIGFTPQYLVATWVGNNDGSFMNSNLVSGITGAAPIWHEVMSFLLKDAHASEFTPPAGLVPVKVCATNGLLTCPFCPQEKIEYFTADKVPTKKCFFRPAAECTAVKAQAEAENKSDEEKKTLLAGCAWVN